MVPVPEVLILHRTLSSVSKQDCFRESDIAGRFESTSELLWHHYYRLPSLMLPKKSSAEVEDDPVLHSPACG